jgi:hypothetical protein
VENVADSHALQPDEIAFRQWVTTAPDATRLLSFLAESPLFDADGRGRRVRRFAWHSLPGDEDRSPFPLGRIVVFGSTTILEALAEHRLDAMRRLLEEHGMADTTSDQTRTFPVATVLERPSMLLAPLEDDRGGGISFDDVAAQFLRMAWAFLPQAELSGRTACAAVRTGRGRAALDRLIEGLPPALGSWHPLLSRVPPRALRALLLPRAPESSALADPKETENTDDRRRTRTAG